MTVKENLASLSDEAKDRLSHIVVIEHDEGTEVFGTDTAGEQIADRFKSFGNLPWTAVLGAILREAGLGIVEPGAQDLEPGTGFQRYTFRAKVY